ncbi:bacillithiol biosynthesis deacetylase BshB2 [Ammoniphilus sp. CFH 90114]|uniref:bacillithiol biosynthesis deacetylase BshB2 n=1 Tax=Ammoniphilus sp. CFH 90114 TaxID=2493665 RepID=UPI00100F0CA4|nr:bacillithiol biosynthesis deacetylase BshB2 [Ammoniphilus sp. CFH 90114]RXT15480.1 bacillithiol biosynthesis deacetylase BshB2 [Ammoniphilus sp. CFH 90114]
MNERVLMVFPHPDDEVFFCSGTVMEYISKGVPVTYLCLTLGEMGRGLGGANRHTLPELRLKELNQSCEIIGIKDLRLGGYRDKTLEFEDPEPIIGQLVQLIKKISPSLIITFYPGESVHPDHDITGSFVVEAVRRLPEEDRPIVYGSAVFKTYIDKVGGPDVVNDVTTYMDRKVDCLKAYPSQFMKYIKTLNKGKESIAPRMRTERFWILK